MRPPITTALALLMASNAFATEVSLRIDGSAAIAVSEPQRNYYSAGFSAFGGAQFGLAPFFDLSIDLGYTFLVRNPASPLPGHGSALWVGPSARFHLPFEKARLSPWLHLGAAYVRTGTLDRPGVRAGAGVFFFLGPLRLGPHVEVQQIFRVADAATFPTRDGTFVTFGVSVEGAVYTSAAPEPPPDPAPAPPKPAPPPPPPAVVVDPDPDRDGILGAEDGCPMQPEDRDGFLDGDGCPEADNDGDGLLDANDECPSLAGPAALRGCPDGDGDQVPDRVDLCPKVPGLPSEGGCPQYKQVHQTETKIEIEQKIFFDTAKTTIQPKSYALLDEVVRAVKDRGDICLVVEGHTDSVGGMEYNMNLSDGRAASVRKYLMEHGVALEKLSARGYGLTKPIADNKTAEGREKNRRVEFVIVPCQAP